jgi:hypothetical protein
MRTIILLYFLIFSSFAQAQISDSFTDGDVTSNPAWTGDLGKFVVNGSLKLQLSGLAANDTAFLSTPSSALSNTEWSFFMQMNFAPSDNNLTRVYLVSDQANLKSNTLQGYYLKLGENGSNDAIELVRQQGTMHTVLCRGANGRVSFARPLFVKVLRDVMGNWNVYVDTTGTKQYVLESQASDTTIQSAQFFGFYCKYTSSNKTNFIFDDVYIGPERIDTSAPIVNQVTVINNQTLRVSFDEIVDSGSAFSTLQYYVDQGIGFAQSVTWGRSHAEIDVVFPSPFPNAITCSLSVGRIADVSGNVRRVSYHPFSIYRPQPLDVIITEILADPDPTVGLPNVEYLEIYNRKNIPISVENWTIDDGGTPVIFPATTIPPMGYAVVVAGANASNFQSFGQVIALTSLPSLNNSGDLLTLKDNNRETIHSVNYSDTWYGSSFKKNGGWSLEMIDLQQACMEIGNWKPSINTLGGTPAQVNSVHGNLLDTISFDIVSITCISEDTMLVQANKPFQTPQIGWFSSDSLIIDTIIQGPNKYSFMLVWHTKMKLGQPYWFFWNNMLACNGSHSGKDSMQIGLPVQPKIGDWKINEILFDPNSGGSDYLEVYHAGNQILDLKDLVISTEDASGAIVDFSYGSSSGQLASPGNFFVFTSNTASIQNNYFCRNPQYLVQTTLPSFPTTGIQVSIRTKLFETLDSFMYNESWHSPLLKSTKGVALERIDLNQPTNKKENWYSAASTSGYGTPTAPNSQRMQGTSTDLSWSSEIISPNGDGVDDFLLFQVPSNQIGTTISVSVFDPNGFSIAQPYNQLLAANQNELRWDGTDKNGQIVSQGMYIVLVQVQPLKGGLQMIKKPIVVVR